MKTLIEKYIEDKKYAWSPTTCRSERHRLNAVCDVLDGNPDSLFNHVIGLAPYTRVTLWTRVVSFWDYLIEEGIKDGPNPYRTFRKKNAKAFKNCYAPKLPTFGYEEARQAIERIARPESKAKALQLLEGGLRYAESLTLEGGEVTGKGGKKRKVFVDGVTFGISYRTFLRDLKDVGLTPHLLRKLQATRLAQKGATEADLCAVFGWASFQTARVYVAPRKEERLRELLRG